jgi:hypothetical protein
VGAGGSGGGGGGWGKVCKAHAPLMPPGMHL